MARKRTSSDMVEQARPEGAPRKSSKDLVNDLNRLCRRANIPFVYEDETASPSRQDSSSKKHIRSHYAFLFWNDKEALDKAVASFSRLLRDCPQQARAKEAYRVNLLLEELRRPAKGVQAAIRTPKSARVHNGQPDMRPLSALDLSPPPSPTIARARAPDIRRGFAAAKPRSTTPSPPPIPLASKPRLNDLSFAITSATTSFRSAVDTSFGSEVGPSGSHETAATSFSSDFAPPPKFASSHGYSVSTNEAAEMANIADHFECSQESSSTDATVHLRHDPMSTVPRSVDPPSRESQSTFYGSSIGTTLFEIGQEQADEIFNRQHYVQNIMISDTMHPECEVHPPLPVDHPSEFKRRREVLHPALPAKSPPAVPTEDERFTEEPIRFSPADNFAQFRLPSKFSHLPFHVQWEAQRVLQNGSIKPGELASQWTSGDLSELYAIASTFRRRFATTFDLSETPNYDNITLTAKLEYARSGNGVLFDVTLRQSGTGDSSELQRTFGSDRILLIDTPSLMKPPGFLKGKTLTMLRNFRDMAATPQQFLGRTWFLLLSQPIKNKTYKDPELSKPGARRLTFVAIDKDLTLTEVLAYTIPYHENAHQPARKMYSRLELYASSTTRAFKFEEHDVEYMVPDQRATSDSADKSFLDPSLEKEFDEPQFSERVMNDGCCWISPWAMAQVCMAMKKTEVHSALQARFAGAKGVWYKEKDNSAPISGLKPPGPHLRVSSSQIKVIRRTLAGCHPKQLFLNVNKLNATARPSLLHIGFLPILVDRGVPRESIFEVIRSQLKVDTDELEQALRSSSPLPLRRWIHSRNSMWEDRKRAAGVPQVAGFPKTGQEKIVRMLESGFLPHQDAFLAREVNFMITASLKATKKNFKIRLARSTTLMGIADPLGCLGPGEVHVHFSSAFRDQSTGVAWPMLHNLEALIARNPAMSPENIQRVRMVFKPELAHLPDVVIFPTKGKRSLAELLQGGDFDGDTYWLCWEPTLVEPFRNAPAPWDPPPIGYYGIRKNKDKLCDFVRDPTSETEWCNYLAEMAVVRMQPTLLGVVTRLYERLIYLEGGIDSKRARDLVYLHDYLVDAAKQGYDFDDADLNRFKDRIDIPKLLPVPLHWEFTKADDQDDTSGYPVDVEITGNILDELFFGTVKPMLDAAIKRIDNSLSVASIGMDPDITKFYTEFLSLATADPVLRDQRVPLEKALREVRDMWSRERDQSMEERILHIRSQYDAILPMNPQNECDCSRISDWTRRQGHDLSFWEKLKASAFARLHYETLTKGALVFLIAGKELCILKAHEVGETQTITSEAWHAFKLRKATTIEIFTEEDDEDVGGVDDLDGPAEDI